MKVYRCYPTGHQGVMPDGDDGGARKLAMKPLASFKQVKFPDYYVGTLKEKRGNFFRLFYSALLFDTVAKEALGDIGELAGESYNLNVEDLGQLTFLNSLETCEDALNRDETRFRRHDGDKKIGPMEFVFYPQKIITKTGLFKIPDDRYSEQYLVTDSPHQKLDFFKIYHDNDLTGLKFEKIWESN